MLLCCTGFYALTGLHAQAGKDWVNDSVKGIQAIYTSTYFATGDSAHAGKGQLKSWQKQYFDVQGHCVKTESAAWNTQRKAPLPAKPISYDHAYDPQFNAYSRKAFAGGQLSSIVFRQYDKQGNLLNEGTSSGAIITRKTYNYDSSHHRIDELAISRYNFQPPYTDSVYTLYEYSMSGDPVKVYQATYTIKNGRTDTAFVAWEHDYDNRHRVMATRYFVNEHLRKETNYNSRGDVASLIEYDDRMGVVLNTTHHYQYDAAGHVTVRETLHNQVLALLEKFTYNSKGLKTQYYSYSSEAGGYARREGQPVAITRRCLYSYNKYNQLARELVLQNGKPAEITEYTYVQL